VRLVEALSFQVLNADGPLVVVEEHA